MSGFSRRVVDASMPPGRIWNPAPGGDFDALLGGLADIHDAVLVDLGKLADIRNPAKCPAELVPDLEREFGIISDDSLSLTDRRKNLSILRYKRHDLATVAKLQRALDKAGFGAAGYGLTVTQNGSPATDPASIIDASYQMVAHAIGDGSPAVAGNTAAYAGQRGGYYLVNGDRYQSRPLYPQAGMICARAFDGSDSRSGEESAGHYSEYTLYENEYSSPPAGYWSLIVFLGGTVARNANGSVAAISAVPIPSARRQELHRLILRVLPLGIWAGIIVQYI